MVSIVVKSKGEQVLAVDDEGIARHKEYKPEKLSREAYYLLKQLVRDCEFHNPEYQDDSPLTNEPEKHEEQTPPHIQEWMDHESETYEKAIKSHDRVREVMTEHHEKVVASFKEQAAGHLAAVQAAEAEAAKAFSDYRVPANFEGYVKWSSDGLSKATTEELESLFPSKIFGKPSLSTFTDAMRAAEVIRDAEAEAAKAFSDYVNSDAAATEALFNTLNTPRSGEAAKAINDFTASRMEDGQHVQEVVEQLIPSEERELDNLELHTNSHGDEYLLDPEYVEPIPGDFPVQPLAEEDDEDDEEGDDPPAWDRKTCGHCNLSWDDSASTTWTPAPAGRCPFEYFHKYPEEEKPVDDTIHLAKADFGNGPEFLQNYLNSLPEGISKGEIIDQGLVHPDGRVRDHYQHALAFAFGIPIGAPGTKPTYPEQPDISEKIDTINVMRINFHGAGDSVSLEWLMSFPNTEKGRQQAEGLFVSKIRFDMPQVSDDDLTSYVCDAEYEYEYDYGEYLLMRCSNDK